MSHLNLTVSPSIVKEQLTELYNTSTPLALSFVLGGVGLVLTTVLASWSKRNSKQLPYLWGLPIVGSWKFFTARYDFVMDGLQKMSGNFQFNILRHKVVVLEGEEERKLFLSNRELSFTEGYKILFAGAPDLDDIDQKAEHVGGDDQTWFSKRLNFLLKRERLDKIMSLMFLDLDRLVKRWGDAGTFDPFEDIYNMVFQLTIRAGACNEIADNPERVSKLIEQYWIIENSSTPSVVLLPWLPSKQKKARTNATGELYMMIKDVIDDREKTGRRHDDALQSLLDQGDSTNDIVGFVMGFLFAGIINTGMMAAWILLHLDANPEWKAKVVAELRAFLAKYADPNADLATQLGQLSTSVWEDEMLTLELCLRETMRLIVSGVMLRRNIAKDIALPHGGKVVKAGNFMALPTGKIHMNPDIYTNPEKFDPDRFLPPREEDKRQYGGFVGWGFGRHPCLGMRFAKLEIKCMLALFLTAYEYEVVDKNGQKMSQIPEPDRNNITKSAPAQPSWIKYRKIHT